MREQVQKTAKKCSKQYRKNVEKWTFVLGSKNSTTNSAKNYTNRRVLKKIDKVQIVIKSTKNIEKWTKPC